MISQPSSDHLQDTPQLMLMTTAPLPEENALLTNAANRFTVRMSTCPAENDHCVAQGASARGAAVAASTSRLPPASESCHRGDRVIALCYLLDQRVGTNMANVAFILADLYEDSEFIEPWQRARDAGHQTTVIGDRRGAEVKGKKGHSTTTEQAIADVRVDDFDALVIPGGYSPDKLRVNEAMVDFTREFVQSGKPVAAICHAGWMLAEADVVRDRRLTSVRNIRTDLVNAGADWVDQEVVVDANLITSRTPADLPPFCDELLEQLK
jgi:protease I